MKLHPIIFTMLLSSVFIFSCSDDKDNNEGVTAQRTIVDLIPKKNLINIFVIEQKISVLMIGITIFLEQKHLQSLISLLIIAE